MKKITLGEFERTCNSAAVLRLVIDSENQKHEVGLDYILEFDRVSVTQIPDIIKLEGRNGVVRLNCIKGIMIDDSEELFGGAAFYITYGRSRREKTLCIIKK